MDAVMVMLRMIIMLVMLMVLMFFPRPTFRCRYRDFSLEFNFFYANTETLKDWKCHILTMMLLLLQLMTLMTACLPDANPTGCSAMLAALLASP